MLYEKIDLYEYFCVPRAGAKGGFLTSLATDVFFETGADHAYPAMIVVPGGAYFMCSRREADPVAFRFAAEGFQTFVLDYSVQTAYPAPLIEAAMAVAYVRENAPKYAVNAQNTPSTKIRSPLRDSPRADISPPCLPRCLRMNT